MSDIPPVGAVGARAHPPSAVSWPAIFAGAVVALAASMLLTVAAAGLGFKLEAHEIARGGDGGGGFTPTVGAYAIIVQVLSAALGGYVAGRLRTTWLELHADEAHFRDTAHGLITWAVATVAMVAMAGPALGGGAEAVAGPETGVAASSAAATLTAAAAERAANIAAQAALFLAIGMLLSAFVAAVAARIGGMQHEEAHARGRA